MKSENSCYSIFSWAVGMLLELSVVADASRAVRFVDYFAFWDAFRRINLPHAKANITSEQFLLCGSSTVTVRPTSLY